MACAYGTLTAILDRDRTEYACMGVPPEKEVTPEPRENGATLAAIGRILRGALARSRTPAPAGTGPAFGRD